MGLSTSAFAEGGSSSKAAAEALFNEGRRLAGEGHFAEACPKFEASQKSDPALGTLLNLADCYEKVGKTASAWAQYREAIPLARAAGSQERIDLATGRATALEAHLSTLTIRVPASHEGVTVGRDGAPVDSGELGSAIPVDPGEHEVTASAPGHKPWSTKVQVKPDSDKVVVDVPELEAGPATETVTTAPTSQETSAATGSSSAQRPIAIAVGAVGVVGLGLGAFFGISANSSWKDAKGGCTDYPYQCSSDALGQRDSASTKATVSTIAFIAGGVALAAGTVLWFTAPSGSSSVALGVGPGSVTARGSF
jgi:hypothetical protein